MDSLSEQLRSELAGGAAARVFAYSRRRAAKKPCECLWSFLLGFKRRKPVIVMQSTSAAQSSSLFAPRMETTQQQQQQQPPTNSLFGSLSQPKQETQSVYSTFQPKQTLGSTRVTDNANPAYFDQLLERGKKRQNEEHLTGFGDLPTLQLGLQDISRKVRNLGQGGPSAGLARGADAQARYVLSASGVNVGKSLRDLEDLIDQQPAQASQAPDSSDGVSGVKRDLAQRYQDDFQKMVDSHIKRAHDDFDKMIDEKLHDVDWNAHRQRIYEHFGLKKAQLDQSTADNTGLPDTGSFGRSGRKSRGMGASKGFGVPDMAKSVIGTPGPKGARASQFGDVAEKLPVDGMRVAPEDRILRMKQEKYADRVKELNVARLQEKVYPLTHKFADVEAEPTNEDTSMLVHAYKALVQITSEDASKESLAEPEVVRERQYATAYLTDVPGAKDHIALRKRILNGSRKFLEQLYLTQLEAVVAKSPREANTGGVPTILAKVKGFVRVKASRRELGADLEVLQLVNGDYCWAVVFFLLRCGLAQEALEYVESKENATAFRQIDRKFMTYLRAYATSEDRRLPQNMQTAINNEYSQRMHLAPEDSLDPYKMMCYKVIGRCDLQRRGMDTIHSDMMDWVWLQFALAREYNRVDELQHEAFGLDEIRRSIKEIGERYFGAGSDIANAPTTFFFMQILAGMFEKAVSDLYPHNYVSATHFAIALDFYGLLRVSGVNDSDDLLTYTTRQQPQIAFGSMIGLYTRDFRTANPTGAVDYLALLCLNADLTGALGKAQRELCHQALTELVLETREFASLLGDIRADGQRIKGAIEQRLKLIGLEDEQEFLKHITIVAARTAEDQSRVTDAALLFHLSEDYDKVIQIVNEAVSLSLTTELGEQAQKLTPLKPRSTQQGSAKEPEKELQGSLSLTTVDDPVDLAKNFRTLYGSAQMYYGKIKAKNSDACNVLLTLSDARKSLETGKWANAVDVSTSSPLPDLVPILTLCSQYINGAGILPTAAHGNISLARQKAQGFNEMPNVIARTVGHVMIWCVVGCTNQVEVLRNAEFETAARRETMEMCVQTAKDVMVFAGLIRYKLPSRVWEALAVAGQELGAY